MGIAKYFEGRIGRLDYIKAFFIVFLLGGASFSIVVSVYNVSFTDVPINGLEAGIKYGMYIWILLLPAFSKRMHDIGHSGLWLLGAIWFPPLGLLLLLLLSVWSGQDKLNKYGGIPVRIGSFFGTLYKSGSIKDSNK